MIIAGPCLFNPGDGPDITRTVAALDGVADIIRVKLWGGGTTPERWFPGIGAAGLEILEALPAKIITEVQTPEHIKACKNLYGIWIGARNCQNYGLLQAACEFKGELFIKRGPAMSIKAFINLYEICQVQFGKSSWLIERGIDTPDKDHGRWSPDLKIAYQLKEYRPDLFKRLVIDCAHSAGEKAFIPDIYTAFKAIGCQNFMFEVFDGEPQTDIGQNLTSSELKHLIVRGQNELPNM